VFGSIGDLYRDRQRFVLDVATEFMHLTLEVATRALFSTSVERDVAAEALGEAIGMPLSPFDRSHPDYEGLLVDGRSRLGEAAWETARTAGWAMTPDEAIDYALEPDEPTPPLPENVAALLSEREVEVLRPVARGLTDSQVAERLYLSPRPVGQHLRSIYRKLGVPSRAAAAREAVERHLI
jgi:DNA-binding CsgD family transcriptional regulator